MGLYNIQNIIVSVEILVSLADSGLTCNRDLVCCFEIENTHGSY